MMGKWIVSSMILLWLTGCGPMAIDELPDESMSYEQYKVFADKADLAEKCYSSLFESRYCFPNCEWPGKGIALGCQACQEKKCGEPCTQIEKLGSGSGICDTLGSCVGSADFVRDECEPAANLLTWIHSDPAGIDFSKSEITVDQYRACVDADKCTEPEKSGKSNIWKCNWGSSDRDNHPINCVTWNQAVGFCEWAGGRIPTDAEWYDEASNNGLRRTYPWTMRPAFLIDEDDLCDYTVWGDQYTNCGCGRGSTWPVCSKVKGNSVSGLCDMSGNVWEWAPSWNDGGTYERSLRGGSWRTSQPEYLSVSEHGWENPDSSINTNIGFRCGRDSR